MRKRIGYCVVRLLALFVTSGCLILVCSVLNVKAQSMQGQSAENPDSINFEDQQVIYDYPLLAEYVQCNASVKNSIKECDKFNPSPMHAEVCRRYFNEYHGFFARLLIEGPNSPVALSRVMDDIDTPLKGMQKQDIISFFKGWINNDVSVCNQFSASDMPNSAEQLNKCKSMITGDPAFCNTTFCKNQAHYIKAIKTRNMKECLKVEDPLIRAQCIGYITKSENECKKIPSFVEFKNKSR